MKLKFLLCALLTVGQTGTGDCRGIIKPPRKSPLPNQEKIDTVPYCDLVKDQAKYDGKLVRVRAIVLGWSDGTSLYDSTCNERGFEPVLDCKAEEECSTMRKALQKEMDYYGDVGRVEAFLIGRVVASQGTSAGKSRSKFMIKRIEKTKHVSRDVPWPDQ
jgi:hypothetical protein